MGILFGINNSSPKARSNVKRSLNMLDRQVVEEFLDGEFEEGDWEIPADIPKDKLVEM